MPGVAFNTSKIVESVKNNHVTYDIYVYQQVGGGYCGAYDEDGNCIYWVPPVYDWVYSGSSSTHAKINGEVVTSSNVYVNGKPIAKVGDQTNEFWIADPSVPPDTSTTQYRNIRPGTSGSGYGQITIGNSSNVYVGGQSVAVIGSQVTTHLGNTTTIQDGSGNVFIG